MFRRWEKPHSSCTKGEMLYATFLRMLMKCMFFTTEYHPSHSSATFCKSEDIFPLNVLTRNWKKIGATEDGMVPATARQDDVIKWKHFPRYWPFVRGIHRWPVNSPHKGQWRGALTFSLICALSKQWWGWWFETPSCPLWRLCNGNSSSPSYKVLYPAV